MPATYRCEPCGRETDLLHTADTPIGHPDNDGAELYICRQCDDDYHEMRRNQR